MRIEKIEKNRIKVTLTDAELEDMNINIGMLVENSSEVDNFLVEIMDIIKAETGFCAENAQTVIEAIPEKNGVVLLVSKIPQRRNIHGIRAVRRDETCILELESFDDVCEMIVHLPAETLEKMRLYGILDRFYITTGRKNITALMYEYCTKCKKNSTAEARLGEYAAMIADGKALAKIALNEKKLK